jgi:hypothetical protein
MVQLGIATGKRGTGWVSGQMVGQAGRGRLFAAAESGRLQIAQVFISFLPGDQPPVPPDRKDPEGSLPYCLQRGLGVAGC